MIGIRPYLILLFAAIVDSFPTMAAIPQSATSSDGYITVTAVDDPRDGGVGFRLPILHFANAEIEALSKVCGKERKKVKRPGLMISALDGRTNDTRVLAREYRHSDGTRYTRIRLPSPGYSDLAKLREAIARAYLNRDFPDWVVQGLMRCADDELRHADERFVLELWSGGRLPFFPALCTDLRSAKGNAAALPGYMVSWMREKKVFGKLENEKWDGRKLAEMLTGETDPVRQDRASDERLLKLSQSVLTPGRPAKWDILRFASHLDLYSPLFDRRFNGGISHCTFHEALDLCESNLVVRAAAFVKAKEIPFLAIGRGDGMKAVSDAYVRFLLGIAAEEKRSKLEGLLGEAEMKLEMTYEKDRKDNNR